MRYSKLELKLIQQLSALQLEDRFRSLQLPSSGIDFWSNDYLGFGRRPLQQFLDCIPGLADLMSASTGSRLISGNSTQLQELEYTISQLCRSETALVFNSGYDANVGVISTLARRHDFIFYDSESHASIKDGCRLSFAKASSFKHNDIADLRRQLEAQQTSNSNCFVIIESVYSMSGDLALLAEIIQVCVQFNAFLIVDEAHALGVIGKNGEGLVAALGYEAYVFARIITFGKAIGANGAAVLCSKIVRDYLVNSCRQVIYTTAMPAWQAAKIQFTLECMIEEEELLQQLHSRIRRFIYNIRISSDSELRAEVPIHSIRVGGNTACKSVASVLEKAGFQVKAILSPTVPKGEERIRICLHAFNSNTEIDAILQQLTLLTN